MSELVFRPGRPVLATRTRGKQSADELRELAIAHPGSSIIVDFTGVKAATGPYLQELLAALEDQFDGFRFEGMDDDLSETVAFAVSRYITDSG